ncbi:hypothetical protein H171_0148 [[Clostridium] celerecrescens 18A]|uniref:Uncharacterized protein n=1 Tax=[Clostridium] celerecrescens 18A TaxID=1286362 RepID=A0A2M8YZU5_9FIRM|nr:hypothetical protein H171_0148 [[Clostridium] celerecrescens 18A]
MGSFYLLIVSVSIGTLIGYFISRLTCRGEHKREGNYNEFGKRYDK